MKYDEFREHFLSQPTGQLLFLKSRGELIEVAMAALDSVLVERNVSVTKLAKEKIIVNQEQTKTSISDEVKRQVLFGIFCLNF